MVKNIEKTTRLPLKPRRNCSGSGRLVTALIQNFEFELLKKIKNPKNRSSCYVLTQNLHLTPSTQQAEQASFTREKIPRRASQFSLKINKRQSS
jgi:hypothetical protein